MYGYRLSRNGFKFKFVTKLVEDEGDTCSGIQCEVKGSLIIHLRFNHDSTVVRHVVGDYRKGAVLVKRSGATAENKYRCQQRDFQIQLDLQARYRVRLRPVALASYKTSIDYRQSAPYSANRPSYYER